MTSAFFGLETGLRGLRTMQTLVDVTNNNITNANTPGFSRQAGTISATPAFPTPTLNAVGKPGQVGTGVQVTSITRARDAFLDYQTRTQLQIQGNWDTQRDALKQVEALINDPSAHGLSSLLSKYWKSWQDVANNPTDSAVRTSLVEQGSSVAAAFQNLHDQFQQQQRDLDSQVSSTVDEVNSLAQQIAAVNRQISRIEFDGTHANDLRDQRDLLLDHLSQYGKVNANETTGGMVNVYLGGRPLVERDTSNALQSRVPAGQTWSQVQWASDSKPATVGGGKLQGLQDSRDGILQRRINDLDALAGRVIDSVNAIHMSGVGLDGKGGVAFFSGTSAANIAVNSVLTAPGGTDKVAAAQRYADATAPTGYSYARGDSSNAVAIAALQSAIAQRSTTSGLQPGAAFGSVSVPGIDVARMTTGSTVNMSVAAGSISVMFNGTTPGTLTVGSDASGNQVVTVEATTLGVRLTLVAPAAMSLSSVLAPLNGQSLTTATAPSTIGDQYGQQIAALGVESSSAQNQSTNQQVLVSQLQKQREQTSGVSLDEETTHLIQYQRAYQAAARLISTADQMLDTLIHNTGIVGR